MTFACPDYWAGRYRSGGSKEWYLSVSQAADLFAHYLTDKANATKRLSVLHLGCGDSLLPVELSRRFPGINVHSVDFEPGVVATMQRKYATAALTWAVEDVRSLSSPADHFDVVLDKGCFDALKVGEDSVRMLQEVYRVMRRGGVLVCLSNTHIFFRKTLLELGRPFLIEMDTLVDKFPAPGNGDESWDDTELVLIHCRKPVLEGGAAGKSPGGAIQREVLVLHSPHWVMRWTSGERLEITFWGQGGDLFYCSRFLRMERLKTWHVGTQLPELPHGNQSVASCDKMVEIPQLEVMLPFSVDVAESRAKRKKDRVVVLLLCSKKWLE